MLEKIRAAWNGPEQQQVLKEWFPKLPKISIDYGVMENANNVYGIRLNCQWHDLGSFKALRDIVKADSDGNIVFAKYVEIIDSHKNIIVTENDRHLLALIGIENIIIAHSPDATLVCPVDQADRLKELLVRIDEQKMNTFL